MNAEYAKAAEKHTPFDGRPASRVSRCDAFAPTRPCLARRSAKREGGCLCGHFLLAAFAVFALGG